MLYYLALLKGLWRPLNVFQYITLRAGGAALTSLAISLMAGPALIRGLRRFKVEQIQRTNGPQSHLHKHGTPTMGGVLIFLTLAGSALLWMRWDDRFTWLLLAVSLALAAVGAWDDYVKLILKDPRGAPSRVKFAVQGATALLAVFYLALRPPNPACATMLNVPYAKDFFLDLGVLYFVLAAFMVVGSSNAVNLTDGLDGLAAGSIIFCAITYGVLAYLAGNAKFSAYLRIVHVDGAGEIAVFLSAMAGSCLGFLWFNAYPAQMFMGDTGSLFLGGVIAVISLCIKAELLLPVVGGVFVMETLSVLVQMASFKFRHGKRVFKMAPLHHHYELSGVAEPKVTVRFWIVSIVLMLTALASLKIR